MAEASFAAAFLGGVLSLLAPCSALLLPAFFAYAFTAPGQLFGRTVLFLAGLSSVFVPLGLGAALVGALLIDHRDTTVLIAGLLMIAFGLLALTGRGFVLLPSSLAARIQSGPSTAAVYSTGLVYGLSGFCAGPLLGAVLTVAGSTANPLHGAALLFTYSFGVAAPLFVIAWLWDRHKLGRRAWLRGRVLRLGVAEVHSTSLLAGAMFILLGVSFITSRGSTALSGLYVDLGLDELGFRAQDWVERYLASQPDWIWAGTVLLVAGLVFLGRALQRRQAARADSSSSTPRPGPVGTRK